MRTERRVLSFEVRKDSLLVGKGKRALRADIKHREVGHQREKQLGILDLGKPPQSPGCLLVNHDPG